MDGPSELIVMNTNKKGKGGGMIETYFDCAMTQKENENAHFALLW